MTTSWTSRTNFTVTNDLKHTLYDLHLSLISGDEDWGGTLFPPINPGRSISIYNVTVNCSANFTGHIKQGSKQRPLLGGYAFNEEKVDTVFSNLFCIKPKSPPLTSPEPRHFCRGD